jgi:sugar lactone lactonase YvrE
MVNAPNGIVIDSTNKFLYVTDANNNINKVDITSGKYSILADNSMSDNSKVVNMNTLTIIPVVIIVVLIVNFIIVRSF